MNKFYITILVIILAVLSVAFVWQKNGPKQTAQQSNTAENLPKEPQIKITEDEVNPVSLQALINKDFDGRDLQLGRVLEENSVYTRYFITYKSGELTISGIMNLPKGVPPKDGFPVLILNHGHIDTSIYTNGRGLRREQDYLARQGYTIIHPDYRNHAQSDKDPNAETDLRLGYAEDVLNAVYAVKNSNLPNINTGKIGMLGHSMGGGVALNVMVIRPELVKAFVLYAPVSANYEDNFKRWTEKNPELANKITNLYGSPETAPDFWKNISAENFFSRVQSPTLIFHGTKDDSVPYEWSTNLEQKLTDSGKNAELITFTNEAHEFGPQWTNFMVQTTKFFAQNLK